MYVIYRFILSDFPCLGSSCCVTVASFFYRKKSVSIDVSLCHGCVLRQGIVLANPEHVYKVRPKSF